MASDMATAAARWWADLLEMPTIHDNRDSYSSTVATSMALDTPTPTKEQLDLFAGELATRLEADPSWKEGYMFLDVDYEPCDVLSESAEKADINDLRFPWKTRMWIDNGEIKVARGYGARPVIVWPKENRD